MKKSIKIAVPKPCEQEWSTEFISNREQLCLLCSEKVYDATTLSDNELHELVNQKDRPKCMKFKQTQLNRPILVSSNHFNYKKISNAFYGLLVAGLVVSCSVQKEPQKSIADYEQLFQTDSFFSDSLKYVIRGVVVDYKQHYILDNVDIEIYTNNYYNGVTVNASGQFKIEIPESKISDTIYLEMNGRRNEFYVGRFREYYEGNFQINKDELPLNKVFILEEPEEVIIGAYLTPGN